MPILFPAMTLPPSLQAALEALPHGPEFRFLDRILALEPGQSATGVYTLRGDEFFLRGHFPEEPLLPGVLLIEAGAQLAGIVVQSALLPDQRGRLRLAGLRAVKILGTARPGETIRLEARLLQQLGNLVQVEAHAFLENRPILHAELTLGRE